MGGIRGALTLDYLKKLQDIVKQIFSDHPDFRLCVYFNLIDGISSRSTKFNICLLIDKSLNLSH